MNPTLARLRRLLVMVPWLLEHPGVGVDEVAERFDATPKEVLDDIDVLGYCGLPGYGGGDLIDATVAGGRVTVRMADFFARPLALSVREGLALLLAARATRDSGVLGDAATPVNSAIGKLETHLGGEASLPVAMDVQAGGADMLSLLMPAVEQMRVVEIVYRSASKGEQTTRQVEPWALRSVDGAWYLQGWCRLAESGRAFRLDRIQSATVTDEAAPAPPPDPPRPPRYEPEPGDPVVVLDVGPGAAWIVDQVAGASAERQPDGRLRLRFQTSTLAWAATLTIRLGGAVSVISPPELQALVRERAMQVLARYDHPA